MERDEVASIAAEMRHLPREVRDASISAAKQVVIDGRKRFGPVVRRNFEEDDGA